MKNRKLERAPRRAHEAAFTMIELMVAMAIFLIISAAAFSLFASHQPVFSQQQNLAEVNIALRNAVAQMQLDIANAGANYYAGNNIPNYPVGVTVTNNVVAAGGDCRSGTPLVYGANCFDSFNIITADSSTPPTNPVNTGCAVTSSSSTIYLAPSGVSTGYATAALATAAAANYKSGDQLLLVKSDGSQYTTIQLTAAGSTGTGSTAPNTNLYVALTGHTTTTAAGLNTTTTDPYNMSTNTNSMLGATFCSTDYLLRLIPITYSVDTSTSVPTLIRTVAGTTQTLAQKTLATQVIGFKVGVSLFNATTDTDTTTYCFNAQSYDPNCPGVTSGTNGAWAYNYTLVRSMMVSLIGRTNPSVDPTYVYRNSFDSGSYQIQGVSAVINPRNMSMTD